MDEGGTLTIMTCLEKEDVVLLSVVDDGPGIDPEVLKDLGKPFQTTKDVGPD